MRGESSERRQLPACGGANKREEAERRRMRESKESQKSQFSTSLPPPPFIGSSYPFTSQSRFGSGIRLTYPEQMWFIRARLLRQPTRLCPPLATPLPEQRYQVFNIQGCTIAPSTSIGKQKAWRQNMKVRKANYSNIYDRYVDIFSAKMPHWKTDLAVKVCVWNLITINIYKTLWDQCAFITYTTGMEMMTHIKYTLNDDWCLWHGPPMNQNNTNHSF